MEKKSILLVDDDRVVRVMIKGALEREYNVFEASRYSEAVNQPINRMDLALIDYVLPDRNGFEVLKAIRNIKPSLPAIIITAYSNETVMLMAIRAGVADYLKKPLSLAYLRGRISEILEGKKSDEYPETVGSKEEFIIDGMTAYIENNYTEELKRDKLARMASMDRYKLSKTFKRRIGQSLPSYLNSIRVRKATELLKNPDLNISEITQFVGYGSLVHFERVFRKVYGESPREYRRRSVLSGQ